MIFGFDFQRDEVSFSFLLSHPTALSCIAGEEERRQNDRAVMDAYGFVKGTEARTSESACVAELMKLYQKLTETK